MNSATFNDLAPGRALGVMSKRRSRAFTVDTLRLPSGNLSKGVAALGDTTTDAVATALRFYNSTVTGERFTRFLVDYKQFLRYCVRAVGVVMSLDEVTAGVPRSSFSTSTLILATAASSVDDAYNDMEITITAGTGVGEVRRIKDYTGSTRSCAISPVWGFTPDATSLYSIRKILCTERAIAQAGGAATITLVSTEPDALASKIVGLQIEMIDGNAIGEVRTVASYVNATKVATLSAAWDSAPTTGDLYIIKYRPVVDTGLTAQAGAAADEIAFPVTASSTDDFYNGLKVTITAGTGAGEELTITDYDGATQIATMDDDWVATIDGTSVFALVRSTSVGAGVCLERKGMFSGSNVSAAVADVARIDLEEDTSSLAPIGLTALDIGLDRSSDEEGGVQVFATGLANVTILWDVEVEAQWVDFSA